MFLCQFQREAPSINPPFQAQEQLQKRESRLVLAEPVSKTISLSTGSV